MAFRDQSSEKLQRVVDKAIANGTAATCNKALAAMQELMKLDKVAQQQSTR